MSCSPNRYLRTWQPPRGTLLVRKLKLGPDTPLAECIRIFKTWQAIPFKRKFYFISFLTFGRDILVTLCQHLRLYIVRFWNMTFSKKVERIQHLHLFSIDIWGHLSRYYDLHSWPSFFSILTLKSLGEIDISFTTNTFTSKHH